MKKTAEEIKEEGFSEFIAKPFKIEDMALTVRNVLDQYLNGTL